MMEEDDSIYDDGISSQPVHNIKAFINQFDKPNKLPINVKPSGKPVPSIPKQVKPAVSEKPLPNKIGFVINKDELTKGRLKKVEVSNNIENKVGPPCLPKKPAVTPRPLKPSNLPAKEKENENKNQPDEQSSFNSIKNKFNQGVKPNANILTEKKNTTEIKENFASDKIYYFEGKKYKMLKLQDVSGPAPEKPKLPPELDIYEFLGADIDEEVYEEYDDVELRPTVPSPSQSASNQKTEENNQELYDDTEVDDMAMNGRTPSLIDDDYYEALPELP